MKMKGLMVVLLLASLSFAELTIDSDQPICKLYGIIQTLGTVMGVLGGAYGGFMMTTSHETSERNNAKNMLGGAIIGLIVIWMAPVIINALVDSSVCGW